MTCYQAYGLVIDSEIELPELLASDSSPDVTIRFGSVSPWPEEIGNTGGGFWARDLDACHFLVGVGAFLVRDGREIIVDRLEGVADSILRISILGPALSLLLHQRGRLILHASAVVVDGRAVAFTGDRGLGKSTTAAAFYQRGFDLIAEDVLVLEPGEAETLVTPSYPQVKLWPNSAEALGIDPASLPLVHPELEKRALRFPERFKDAVQPLHRLYVLSGGEALSIRALSPSELLGHVMHNWYGARYEKVMLEAVDRGRHFQNCVAVANSVSGAQLSRRVDLDELDSIIELVRRDLAEFGPERGLNGEPWRPSVILAPLVLLVPR